MECSFYMCRTLILEPGKVNDSVVWTLKTAYENNLTLEHARALS